MITPITTEIKQKWVEALRSGKYTQSRSRLRSDSGYCCLGVLCDVIEPAEWRCHTTELSSGIINNWSYGDNETDNYITLRGDMPITQKLIDMNDTEGKTFSEIADYIEESYNV